MGNGGSGDNPEARGTQTEVIPDTPSVAEKLGVGKPQPLQRPQAPRQATEIEKKATFSMDPAVASTLEMEAPTPAKVEDKPKVETPPKVEQKKEATKPVVKPAVTGTEVVEPLKVGTQTDKAKVRDYTGYSPEQTAVLKQMSNPAFEFTAEIMKQNKELSKLKTSTYLQHPQAYQLDPQFQQIQAEQYYMNAEGQHWQEQLRKILEGEKWVPLLGWNKDGSPRYGQERDPSNMDAEQVRMAMNQCYAKAQSEQGRMQQYAQNFQQQVQTDLNVIQQEQAKRFAWVTNPEELKAKLEIPGLGERTLAQVKQDFLNLIPIYMQSTPMADLAGNMFVALQIMQSKLRAAEAGKQIAETHVEEVQRAEPSSTFKAEDATKGAIRGVTKFSLAGMPD